LCLQWPREKKNKKRNVEGMARSGALGISAKMVGKEKRRSLLPIAGREGSGKTHAAEFQIQR
jgi:hypothetical protein